jgi:hypothetical protein
MKPIQAMLKEALLQLPEEKICLNPLPGEDYDRAQAIIGAMASQEGTDPAAIKRHTICTAMGNIRRSAGGPLTHEILRQMIAYPRGIRKSRKGVKVYRCRICGERQKSQQGLAGHTRHCKAKSKSAETNGIISIPGNEDHFWQMVLHTKEFVKQVGGFENAERFLQGLKQLERRE